MLRNKQTKLLSLVFSFLPLSFQQFGTTASIQQPSWTSLSHSFNILNCIQDVADCFWKPLFWSSVQSHNIRRSWSKKSQNLSLDSHLDQSRVTLACLPITQTQSSDQSRDEELIKLFLVLVSENTLIFSPPKLFCSLEVKSNIEIPLEFMSNPTWSWCLYELC